MNDLASLCLSNEKESMSELQIRSSDRCSYCGHWAGDDPVPFRIYTEERAAWLEQAATLLMRMGVGDDDWFEWAMEGRRLAKEDE